MYVLCNWSHNYAAQVCRHEPRFCCYNRIEGLGKLLQKQWESGTWFSPRMMGHGHVQPYACRRPCRKIPVNVDSKRYFSQPQKILGKSSQMYWTVPMGHINFLKPPNQQSSFLASLSITNDRQTRYILCLCVIPSSTRCGKMRKFAFYSHQRDAKVIFGYSLPEYFFCIMKWIERVFIAI